MDKSELNLVEFPQRFRENTSVSFDKQYYIDDMVWNQIFTGLKTGSEEFLRSGRQSRVRHFTALQFSLRQLWTQVMSLKQSVKQIKKKIK